MGAKPVMRVVRAASQTAYREPNPVRHGQGDPFDGGDLRLTFSGDDAVQSVRASTCRRLKRGLPR